MSTVASSRSHPLLGENVGLCTHENTIRKMEKSYRFKREGEGRISGNAGKGDLSNVRYKDYHWVLGEKNSGVKLY